MMNHQNLIPPKTFITKKVIDKSKPNSKAIPQNLRYYYIQLMFWF